MSIHLRTVLVTFVVLMFHSFMHQPYIMLQHIIGNVLGLMRVSGSLRPSYCHRAKAGLPFNGFAHDLMR